MPREQSFSVLEVGDREPVKPLRPPLVEVASYPELINAHPSSFYGHARYFLSSFDTLRRHHFFERGIGLLIQARGDGLVDRPASGKREESDDHPREPAPDP